jgi:hypothetical protein
MQLLIGFVLGVAGSLAASFLFVWFMPQVYQRAVAALIRNPRLHIPLLADSPMKQVQARIRMLFRAWEKNDADLYASCWTSDAIRVVGPQSTTTQDLTGIAESFRLSQERYESITASQVIFERIATGPRDGVAICEVYYRFALVRRIDHLPIVEESRDLYSLRRIGDGWFIASNIDHFYEIHPGR